MGFIGVFFIIFRGEMVGLEFRKLGNTRCRLSIAALSENRNCNIVCETFAR